MDTVKKGKLGYNILEKELLKRNFDIYVPIVEDTRTDCIIIKEDVLWKLQVKTIQYNKNDDKKYLPVRKISHNQGEYKVHYYTAEEADFFIGVDTDTEDIYICPIEFINNYTSSVGVKNLKQYKNNFTQLEPIIGNSNSGADDIGELLTDNAEGTE